MAKAATREIDRQNRRARSDIYLKGGTRIMMECMKNILRLTRAEDEVETKSSFPGARVTIPAGSARDYVAMRSSQLTALLELVCTGAADRCEDRDVLEKVLGLAAGIAQEVDRLIPAALAEAAKSDRSDT